MILIRKISLQWLLGLSVLLAYQPSSWAQTLEEQTVLAALALNIVRFTTWPAEPQANMKDTLNFCVAGDNVVQDSFARIDHKPVGNTSLKMINLSRLSNFDLCQVLYISQVKQNILLQVFVELKKRPVLTIGEGADFAQQGGMIGLENIDNKITLHINLAVAREANLNISARLLQLAKIIDK
jgi:hypothetical protein